jgi:hypothetical protein
MRETKTTGKGGKMTNEISKQICDLCGIEPIECLRQKGEPCLVEGIQDSCYDCVFLETENPVYPDFTNPVNFVRLLELEFEKDCNVTTDENRLMFSMPCTVMEFIGAGGLYGVSNRVEFLQKLLKFIGCRIPQKDGTLCNNDRPAHIIKAIKNAEWEV